MGEKNFKDVLLGNELTTAADDNTIMPTGAPRAPAAGEDPGGEYFNDAGIRLSTLRQIINSVGEWAMDVPYLGVEPLASRNVSATFTKTDDTQYVMTPVNPLTANSNNTLYYASVGSGVVKRSGVSWASLVVPALDAGDSGEVAGFGRLGFEIAGAGTTPADFNAAEPSQFIGFPLLFMGFSIAGQTWAAIYGDGTTSSQQTGGAIGTAVTAGDVIKFGYNWDTGEVLFQINSETPVSALTLDLTAVQGDFAIHAVYLSNTASNVFNAGSLSIDLSHEEAGKEGFADPDAPSALPANAEDGKAYAVTSAGTFAGKSGKVGDLAILTNAQTDVVFIRDFDLDVLNQSIQALPLSSTGALEKRSPVPTAASTDITVSSRITGPNSANPYYWNYTHIANTTMARVDILDGGSTGTDPDIDEFSMRWYVEIQNAGNGTTSQHRLWVSGTKHFEVIDNGDTTITVEFNGAPLWTSNPGATAVDIEFYCDSVNYVMGININDGEFSTKLHDQFNMVNVYVEVNKQTDGNDYVGATDSVFDSEANVSKYDVFDYEFLSLPEGFVSGGVYTAPPLNNNDAGYFSYYNQVGNVRISQRAYGISASELLPYTVAVLQASPLKIFISAAANLIWHEFLQRTLFSRVEDLEDLTQGYLGALNAAVLNRIMPAPTQGSKYHTGILPSNINSYKEYQVFRKSGGAGVELLQDNGVVIGAGGIDGDIIVVSLDYDTRVPTVKLFQTAEPVTAFGIGIGQLNIDNMFYVGDYKYRCLGVVGVDASNPLDGWLYITGSTTNPAGAQAGDLTTQRFVTDTGVTYIRTKTDANAFTAWQRIELPAIGTIAGTDKVILGKAAGGREATVADLSAFVNGQVVEYTDYGMFSAAPTQTDTVLAAFPIASNMVIPVDFAGSVAKLLAANATGVTLNIKVDGSTVGTITIAAAGSTGTFSTIAETAVAAGSVVTVETGASVPSDLENLSVIITLRSAS